MPFVRWPSIGSGVDWLVDQVDVGAYIRIDFFGFIHRWWKRQEICGVEVFNEINGMISFFALVVWFLKDWLLALEGRLNLRYNPHIKKPFSREANYLRVFFWWSIVSFWFNCRFDYFAAIFGFDRFEKGNWERKQRKQN